MRIAINAQLVSSEMSFRNAGVSRYVRQLVGGLARIDSSNDYYVFTSREIESFVRRPNFHFLLTKVGSRRPAQRILWEQVVLPRLLHRYHIDVLHSPVNVMPFFSPCASVVTVHDLSFLLHPGMHASQRNFYLKSGTAFSVCRCNAVITFSQSVRGEVVKQYGVEAKKIAAIPLAPTAASRAAPVPTRGPYFLCVGTLEPRKNLQLALEAFARIRERIPHELIVVGAKGWRFENLFESVRRLGIDGRTVFTGYVDDTSLASLYAYAEALIYPSLYEGFGLPPIEAMAHGCPVIVSSTPSLVELTGDAAVQVDPHDVGGMVAALLRVAEDHVWREDLARRSLQRAARFSWERTARETLAVYQSILEGRSDHVSRSMARYTS